MDNQIINFYNDGNSIAETSRKFSISVYKVKKILINNNIYIRTRKEQTVIENKKRRKKVDDNFFDVLNKNNCYILGLIASDGNIAKKRNTIKLTLNSEDRYLLELIKEKMNIERKIVDDIIQNKYYSSTLSFSSEKIKNRLKDFGIIPNKTYTNTISMSNIPDNLKKFFILGYIDGDGTVTTYDGKNQLKLSICSYNKKILEEINKFLLKELKIKGNFYKYKNKHLFELSFSTIPSIKILEFLYNESDIFLKRKYNKFKTIINKSQETRTTY